VTILLIIHKNKNLCSGFGGSGLFKNLNYHPFHPCLTNGQKVQISVIPIELSGSGLFPGDAGCLQIPANYDNLKIE
jgi:hypothetical protein